MGSGTNDVALQKASPLLPSFPTLDSLRYSGHYEFSSLGPGVQSLLAQVLCPWHPTTADFTLAKLFRFQKTLLWLISLIRTLQQYWVSSTYFR